jgi:hypothetical protein
MDAKVLQAAVSAAIRVTVSTTLIGCGGSSTDADRASSPPAVQDAPARTDQPTVMETEPTSVPVTSVGGSASVTEMPIGGMASHGGSAGDGMTETAGAGGEQASAGAPADVCGTAAAHACLTQLEQVRPEPPSAADKACCDTVIATLEELWQATPRDACFEDVDARFQGAVRTECCADQSTWVHRACTPWGPPVPPEVSREALRLWSLTA